MGQICKRLQSEIKVLVWHTIQVVEEHHFHISCVHTVNPYGVCGLFVSLLEAVV